ncbi:hypothetical protein EYF80_011329 [Liparis tanakae]|uniref:Uncharacterized protein n=1 Tax=Liparis tanakae TaxID=230148 RepID=A0A4Z2IKL1_9TELE|nr:hypothetical protein EYF80_011329 [Liparis tanakae]
MWLLPPSSSSGNLGVPGAGLVSPSSTPGPRGASDPPRGGRDRMNNLDNTNISAFHNIHPLSLQRSGGDAGNKQEREKSVAEEESSPACKGNEGLVECGEQLGGGYLQPTESSPIALLIYRHSQRECTRFHLTTPGRCVLSPKCDGPTRMWLHSLVTDTLLTGTFKARGGIEASRLSIGEELERGAQLSDLKRGLDHDVALHAHPELGDHGRNAAVTGRMQHPQKLASSNGVHDDGPVLTRGTAREGDLLVMSTEDLHWPGRQTAGEATLEDNKNK